MIRGIKKEQIIIDFMENTNIFNYAKEYGIFEVIDSFLLFTYEGFFNDEEVGEIIDLLEKELKNKNTIADNMSKGLKNYVTITLIEDFSQNKIWSYNENLIWSIQEYLSSCEPTKEDIQYLKDMNLLELLEDEEYE